MSLTSTLFGDPRKGYDQAQRYLDPYAQGGQKAYNDYSGYLGNIRGQLDQYGNPSDWMWSQINQDPKKFYSSIMEGYDQTPEAKYEQDQMMRSANAGALAAGMGGSGAHLKSLQDNAADITRRDQDRYFNNVMGANNQQMQYLNDYRGMQDRYMNGMSGLSSMGQQAAMQQGQYAIDKSRYASPWADFAGNMAGRAAGYFM